MRPGGGPGGGADWCPVPQVPAPAEPRRAALLGRGPLQQVQRRRADRERGPQGEAGRRLRVRGGCPPPADTHTHTRSGQAEPGQSAPLPGRGGSTLVSGVRGHLPGQSLVQSGRRVCKPCWLYAQKETRPAWRSQGSVGASGSLRGNGARTHPTGRTWTPGHPAGGFPSCFGRRSAGPVGRVT